MVVTSESDFADLYRTHYADVLRFVSRRVPPAGGDDVVGETFQTAGRRRLDLPPDPRPWLFRTARNVMLNADRAARRQQAIAVRIAVHATDPGPDAISTVETTLDLSRAWDSLGPADQEVLALHVWDHLSDRDAATVLGCTRAAYSMRLIRSRRRLSRILGHDRATSPSRLTTTGLEHP